MIGTHIIMNCAKFQYTDSRASWFIISTYILLLGTGVIRVSYHSYRTIAYIKWDDNAQSVMVMVINILLGN